MNSNFLNFINCKYEKVLKSSLRLFIIRNKDYVFGDKFVEHISIFDIGLTHVDIDKLSNTDIEFTLHCVPQISFIEINKRNDERDENSIYNKWFSINCRAKIGDTFSDFKINYVDEYSHLKAKNPLNGSLIPVLCKEDYEDYVRKILREYYPHKLNNDYPIDPYELAHNLGFDVVERTISKAKNIFGQIYFEETKVTLYDSFLDRDEEVIIPKNTILIDSEANDYHSLGCKNITIAHECIHAYAHKMAFTFGRIFNKEIDTYLSCTDSGAVFNEQGSKDFAFLEPQANALAPIILLPRNKILRRYHYYLACKKDSFESKPRILESVLHEMAEYYGVTVYAMKKRLLDCDVDEMRNICNFANGKYSRPYICRPDSLKANETYDIDEKTFDDLITDSQASLFSALILGDYVFAENHVVLNDEKYVQPSQNGGYNLTFYALEHIDECCLKFKKKAKNNSTQINYCDSFKREFGPFEEKIELGDSKPDITNPEVAIKINEKEERISSARLKLAGMTFPEALTFLIKEQNYQLNEISDCVEDPASVSIRQLGRYANGETKNLNIRVAVAICIQLNLPLMLSLSLLKCNRWELRSGIKEDDALLTVLGRFRGYKIIEINKYLEQIGEPPLTNLRDS